MTEKFILTMKRQQRLFINGAVLRFDRKVSVELMNDAVFLLEQHILQPTDSITPLRQLYLNVQTMLMAPESRGQAEPVFFQQLDNLCRLYSNSALHTGLDGVRDHFEGGRLVEALKAIRRLLPLETEGQKRQPAESLDLAAVE
jgi:flagellar biosynthesis repressor protein FlbT